MGDFKEIIMLLALVLFSILTGERARAKRMKAQREMQPRAHPPRESIDAKRAAPAKQRPSADEMLRRLRAHAFGFGVEPAVEMPVPSPLLTDEDPEPVVVAEPERVSRRPTKALVPTPRRKKRRSRALLAMIGTREGLRRAILMREVLGPPRAFEEHTRR